MQPLFLPFRQNCTAVAFTFCLARHFFVFFSTKPLSSHADAGRFADQVSLDWEALLRVEELRHGNAGPQRYGKRDCQAITSKAASHANFQLWQ